MGKGFDEYASEYDAWFLENKNVLESEVKLVAATLPKEGNILSVGCGSGLFEKILREDYGIDIRNGVEPSASMAAIARKRGMAVIESTAEDFDYLNGVYDTVLFNGCPGYINDLNLVIKKVYEALPQGGRIILVDIPKESSYGLLYNLAKALRTWEHPLLEGVKPSNPYPIELVNVANWRTTAEKVEMLEANGFKNIDFLQTLTAHPMYTNDVAEEPTAGFCSGDYVAIIAYKL